MPWIDLHTHVNMIKRDPSEVIANAKAQGIERMVLIGTDPNDIFTVQKLARDNFPMVSCTVGIHPHDSSKYTDEVEANLNKLVTLEEVIGIGEIGLDYHYDHSPRDIQNIVFRKQMEIARKNNLAVEIHTREAEEDTLTVLKEYQGKVSGLLHCFTGTKWMAHEALKLGWDISISGVCTFKNSGALRETIKSLPLERIHIETDAPFMTPVPHRGTENEPALLVHTAKFVAELMGVTEEILSVQLKQNAKRLFPKLDWN